MNKIISTIAFVLLSCIGTFGQDAPISLEYKIGEFRIASDNNSRITQRFNQLDRNKTYVVNIVGSADFLGSEDSNINLSNKRVKFAEYHLLQHFGDHRLIIKLDSKGEMQPENQPQTPKGIQEHRMVYIYINEYDAGNTFSSSTRSVVESRDAPTTVVTKRVAEAELIKGLAVSSRPDDGEAENNNGTSTKEQLDLAAIPNPPTENNSATSSNGDAGGLKLKGEEPLRAFDGEGTYRVGDKLLLSDMNFRPGSHYLRPSSIPTLRKLIQVMADNPSLQIEIRGHICCHPNNSPHPDGYDRDAGNHQLSFNRANNIKEYLEKNEIDGSRITAKGMGAKERLVYPEETDDDRTTNRRVEIIVTSI